VNISSRAVNDRYQDEEAENAAGKLKRMTAEIVGAFVSANQIPSSHLPEVIRSVHKALSTLDGQPKTPEPEPLRPAVTVRKSVTPDYIVCLEDGRKLKMLKRYLRTNYNMSPEDYRAKWNLPPDYPMVAPNYASRRSELAKQIGLGRSKDEGEGVHDA